MDYDAKSVAAGLRTFMQIHVMLDIRNPLKCKKKLIIGKTKEFFAIFQYEKLTTFCFLCGRLGHGESFYPTRLIQGSKELPLGWDLSLKAVMRRPMTSGSIWFREPGES